VRRRWLLGILGVLLVAWLASELFLAGVVERRIERRLTRDGGEASVSVQSRPALRLLFSDGRRISIAARGIRIDLPPLDAVERDDAFRHLDGFAEVDLRLTAIRAGPLAADNLVLTRHAQAGAYELRLRGSVSPTDLAEYVGGPLAGLGAQLLTGGAALPLEGDYTVRSDRGRPRIASGSGEVAGVPVGTLGTALIEGVLGRL